MNKVKSIYKKTKVSRLLIIMVLWLIFMMDSGGKVFLQEETF